MDSSHLSRRPLHPPPPPRRHESLLVPIPSRVPPPRPARPRPPHAGGGSRRGPPAPPLPPMSGGSGGSRARLRRGPPVPALDPKQPVQGDAPHTLRFLAASPLPPRMFGFRHRDRIAAGEELELLVRAKTLKLDTRYRFSAPPLRLVAPCSIALPTFFVEEISVAEKESGDWLREPASTSNTVLETLNSISPEIPLDFAEGNFEDQGRVRNLLRIRNFEMQEPISKLILECSNNDIIQEKIKVFDDDQGGLEVMRTNREIPYIEEQESLKPSVMLSPSTPVPLREGPSGLIEKIMVPTPAKNEKRKAARKRSQVLLYDENIVLPNETRICVVVKHMYGR